VKPLDRIGTEERAVIAERATTGYAAPLVHFGSHEALLRSLLDRLLPGVPSTIDLAAFVDAHTWRPMGRGDRRAGVPAEPELFAAGLSALADAGFVAMGADEQRRLIMRMRRGDADADLGVPAKEFVDRLLDKALAGYLAHPDTWRRIGFNGPAYPDGYAWIGSAEAVARHKRDVGWERL
jgi:AcrR family transcriptional regulator